MTAISRRALLQGALASALVPAAGFARASAPKDYPTRAIKWVLPYLAGTGPDNTARILADAVSPLLGQPVVIENRGGAAGNIGARMVANAAPDGYTWIYSAAPMAANMRMFKQPGYDALKDFRHVMRVASSDILLVVNAASGIQTLDELLARLRATPGQTNYASGGVGTPSHLGVEMMLMSTHTQALHVPYKGASEIINAVLGKQVSFGMPIFSVALSQIQAGKLRALAVAGNRRNPMLPDVPTLGELGVKGMELTSWGGVSVPANTPDDIVTRIRGAFDAALKQPAVVTLLEKQGGRLDIQDSATYTKGFTQEIAFTETMMKRLGLQPI